MSFLKKISVSIIISIFVFFGQSKAQFYSTGQDPASAKWKQIKTNNFQIIFQDEFSDEGSKIASILEYYYDKVSKSLDHKPRKISVVVHNQTITSNGYVVWAPKRMELFVTPPQDGSPDPWLEHLCTHELRHVVQIDKLNQGITKILSIVFGQQAIGLVVGQLPMWYLEGDAVCTETALSNFGRGRLPYFHRGIKTHLLSDEKRYSFDKMLFGSYRDYVPSYYELGYQLTAYTRKRYGDNVWANIENHVAKNSYTLLPTTFAFYRGLKKNTGLSQEELYNETYNYLDSIWTVESLNNRSIEPRFLQKNSINEYENYINPIYIDDNNTIALKKGLSHIPQFVLLSKNAEKIIHEPGFLVSNDFSYANNILVWAEYKPDLRWQNREYNSLKLMNIKSGYVHTLIIKSRYFSPDISNTSEKIVVVEVDKENHASLVILDVFNGKIIQKIESENFIQRPKWSADENKIYVIALSEKGKKVSSYDLIKKQWETIFHLKNADIQRIIPFDNKVYFHSTINGTDNVYVYDENSKEIYQMSDSPYGISEFDINTNKSELIVNEYTSQGARLASIPIERALWKKIEQKDKYNFEFAELISKQESQLDSQKVDSEKNFSIKPYRKSLNLFNFHSWIPFYADYENMDLGNISSDPSEVYKNIYPGLMLLSQNKLSTVESILSYGYKNGNHFVSSSVIFKGQYPVVKISANYGDNQLISTTSDATWYPQSNIGYSYDLDIYVPFNFTSGKFIKGFRPLISVEYFDNLYYNYQNNYYIKGLELVQTQLLFYSYQFKAERDIIPQLGAIFNFNLRA